MNDAMLAFIEIDRFLASTTAKPRIVANTEKCSLALTKYDFDEGALLRFQRKTPLVSSNLTGSNGSYEVAISEKTELDVMYFILDENGLFVEKYSNARGLIRDFTGAKLDGQKTLFDGVLGQRTYGVSTNKIEYIDAINFLNEK